jgi:hypothetical protein
MLAIFCWRPRQYDRRVIHDGFRNRYSFVKGGKKKACFPPLTPKQVYEDQLKLKSEIEQKGKGEIETQERKM